MFAIRIAKSDVDTGEFFILQNIADDVIDAKICADGELTDTVRILVRVRVRPEIIAQLLVF